VLGSNRLEMFGFTESIVEPEKPASYCIYAHRLADRHRCAWEVVVLGKFGSLSSITLGTRGDVPSTPASVKALRPLRGAQNRAALTDASAPGEALL
jgi:hypothetical protein